MPKTATDKKVQTTGCPACSHKLAFQLDTQVYRCAQCEGVYGNCYLGDSYAYVLPFMVSSEPPQERVRYFDFTCLGSKGVTRRHGWYDTETRQIVQVG